MTKLDKFSYSLWPELRHLPQAVIEEAAMFVSDPVSHTSGAFNKARFIDDFVLKTGIDNQDEDASCVKGWKRFVDIHTPLLRGNRQHKELLRAIIAPTVTLFDGVLVQKKVNTLAAHSGKTTNALSTMMTEVAYALGIGDMHSYNWGFDKDGMPKMFDIDVYNPPRVSLNSAETVRRIRIGKREVNVTLQAHLANLIEQSALTLEGKP